MRPHFEAVVEANLSVQFRSAAKESKARNQIAARRELKEAMQRLEFNPKLRRLAPDGQITYSDPVLAVAASWALLGEGIREAGVKGSELKNSSLWKWALVGVDAWLHRRNDKLQELASRVPSKGVKILSKSCHIAVVGDAGYRGVVQDNVIDMIQEIHIARPFDLIVHLGDIYFSGGEIEVIRNLLVPFSAIEAPLVTLCGNHDLYHGAEGYLAALQILRQPGRFFLIETPSWRIAALDTSSGAARLLRNDGQLDKVQLEWLKELLGSKDPRPLILMSHHFIISGWDEPSLTLSTQVARLAKKGVFAWYWGHEHRCACYGPAGHGFYGASVGNGAFLEECLPASRMESLADWDSSSVGRCACPGIKPETYWPHGFLELTLSPGKIEETYHLEHNIKHYRSLPKVTFARDTHAD
jgi:hypothetical protein